MSNFATTLKYLETIHELRAPVKVVLNFSGNGDIKKEIHLSDSGSDKVLQDVERLISLLEIITCQDKIFNNVNNK